MSVFWFKTMLSVCVAVESKTAELDFDPDVRGGGTV